jgi:hypothetical protein
MSFWVTLSTLTTYYRRIALINCLEIENHLNYFGRGGLAKGTQKRTGTFTGGTNWNTDKSQGHALLI